MKIKTGELPVFQTQYNARYRTRIAEKFTMPSLAVPDDSLSIADLVRNHLHGQPTNARTKEPIFLLPKESDTDADFFPPSDQLDLIDKQDMLDAAKSEINSIRSEHQERIKQNKKQKEEDQKKIPPPQQPSLEPPSDKSGQSGNV